MYFAVDSARNRASALSSSPDPFNDFCYTTGSFTGKPRTKQNRESVNLQRQP